MSAKRRRPSTTGDAGNARAKRIKFTLDAENIHLPDTTRNGTVLVTGAGDFGQLGLGPDVLEKSRPAAIKLDHEIVDICAGAMHTVCLTKDGRVLTFGCNDEGALGRVTPSDDDEAEFIPEFVQLPGKVKQITAGDSHTVALLEDGRVFAWGTFRDSHGNMGMTARGNERLPHEMLPEGMICLKIASGADHIVFLTKHGDVLTCGCPEQGQLGRTTERSSSRNARSGLGNDQLAKFLVPSPITLKASLKVHFDDIWAGTYVTFLRTVISDRDSKHRYYAFGLNNHCQLGLGIDLEAPQFRPVRVRAFEEMGAPIVQISGGPHHTLILDEDGCVFALGRKEYGRLGLGVDCDDAKVPQRVHVGVERNGVDSSANDYTSKKIVWVSCGATSSFAATDGGELYGWGMGTCGQLGTGNEADCHVPTLITGKQVLGRRAFRVSGGGQHTVMIAADPETVVNEVVTEIVASDKSADKKHTVEDNKILDHGVDGKVGDDDNSDERKDGNSEMKDESLAPVAVVDESQSIVKTGRGRHPPSNATKSTQAKTVTLKKGTGRGRKKVTKEVESAQEHEELAEDNENDKDAADQIDSDSTQTNPLTLNGSKRTTLIVTNN